MFDIILSLASAFISIFSDVLGVIFSVFILLASDFGGILVLAVCFLFIIANVGRIVGGIWG